MIVKEFSSNVIWGKLKCNKGIIGHVISLQNGAIQISYFLAIETSVVRIRCFQKPNMNNLLDEILRATRNLAAMYCSNNFSDMCHRKVLLLEIRGFIPSL